MNKKTIAGILSAVMIFGMGNAAYADSASNVEIESVDSISAGIDVLNKDVEYKDGKYLTAKFNVKNTSAQEKNVTIKIEVYDENSAKQAGMTDSRSISSVQTVPIDFYVELKDIAEPKVKISVNEKISKTFYVSSEAAGSGNGSEEKPLTLAEIPQKIAELDADERYADEDVTFVICEGEYSVNSAVKLEGFSEMASVTLTGVGEDTVLYGGVSAKGSDFTKVTDSQTLAMFPESTKNSIYSLKLSDYGVNLDFSDGRNAVNDPLYTALYVNGEEQTMARYPNESQMLKDAYVTWKPKEKAKYPSEIYPWDGTTDTTGLLSFISKDASQKQWSNYSEAWIRGFFMWDWDMAKGQVYSVEKKTADYYKSASDSESCEVLEINFDKYLRGSSPSENEVYNYYGKSWYIYNLPEELDLPGEYVIHNNVLYICPENEETFSNALLQLNTDSNNMIEVTGSNYTIENLNFENSMGYFVKAEANNFTLKGCGFTKNTKNAATVSGNNNLITQCDFYELGGNGITVSGGDRDTLTNSGSVIENCYFKNCSQTSRTNTAMLSVSGCGVTARRNTLTGAPHLALSYGGNNHIIEYNDFSNCLTDGSTDAGIIYAGANLSNLGTIVRKNYIHNSNSGLAAVYLDDWLSGQRVLNNVFEDVDNAFFIHGGVCNTFSGNIVKNAVNGARVRGKGNTITNKFTTDGGKTYIPFNAWYMYLANSNGEYINKNGVVLENQSDATQYVKYNPHSNTFLSNLVGDAHSANPGQGYNGVDWQGTIWQNAYNNSSAAENYRHVLSYVNNKTDNVASETDLSDNCFINVTTHFGTTESATESLNRADKSRERSEMTSADTALYNDVKNNSGIYKDGYRK